MSDVAQKILEEFLIESFENLSSINEELTRYQRNSGDQELLNGIYRKVHTLKGSASFLGFEKLEKINHISENLLNNLQEGKLKIDEHILDVLLVSFDTCHDIVKYIEQEKKEPDTNYDEILNRLKNANQKIDAPVQTLVSDMLNEGTLTNLNIVEAASDTATDEKLLDISEEVTSHEDSEVAPEAARVDTKPGAMDSTIRVNVSLLDKIMNVVGELVLNRNQIVQFTTDNKDPELTRLGQQLNVITTELQTDVMTTRMQPVGTVFNKFERVIRDLAKGQGKKIVLEIQGGETELDKSLLEMIKDPMVHMMRNAADHGIETPEERVASGKSESGKLIIKAYHEGGQVNIDIVDDGRGLSQDKIIAKAISKKILNEDQVDKMSESKILNLIFEPGFSTAEKVTNISGRGVGMDVVKSNIEKISGKVEVFSKEGFGSTFRLKIPLTLAIIPALIVKSGGETFALPQKNLVELVLLNTVETDKIEKIHGNEFYRLRGELIPIFYLNSFLKLEQGNNSVTDNINIVVMKAEGCVYGLVVDDVLDTQEIVVKPLSHKIKIENIYVGATLMGDGRVALIIDAFGFYSMVSHGDIGESSDLDSDESDKYKDHDMLEVLLCELEDSRIYGIPLCLVDRLEDFRYSQIEWSGDMALIRYREKAMPIIGAKKALMFKEDSLLAKSSDNEIDKDRNIFTIIINVGEHHFGLVVRSIRDIAKVNDEIDEANSDRAGLLGTVFLNENLVSILDLPKVFEITSSKKLAERSSIAIVKKALVADDSSFYRNVISNLLSSNNISVNVFNDGREAINELKSNQDYDIIITDIQMPNLNGVGLAKEIRNLEGSISKKPILAISTLDLKSEHSNDFTSRLKKLDQKKFLAEVERLLTI